MTRVHYSVVDGTAIMKESEYKRLCRNYRLAHSDYKKWMGVHENSPTGNAAALSVAEREKKLMDQIEKAILSSNRPLPVIIEVDT